MSYEPTNWKTGDVVTSAKLNKLENAVAQSGGVYIVHAVNDALDKTFEEIVSAAENNAIMTIATGKSGFLYGFVCSISENDLRIIVKYRSNDAAYIAASRESYPALQVQ